MIRVVLFSKAPEDATIDDVITAQSDLYEMERRGIIRAIGKIGENEVFAIRDEYFDIFRKRVKPYRFIKL